MAKLRFRVASIILDEEEEVTAITAVACDDARAFIASVLGREEGDDRLTDPALLRRWRDVLWDLGNRRRRLIRLVNVSPANPDGWAAFEVPDHHLPTHAAVEDVQAWNQHLTFFKELQLRLLEVTALSRIHDREVGDSTVYAAQEELRRRHFAEYARYRTNAQRGGGPG